MSIAISETISIGSSVIIFATLSRFQYFSIIHLHTASASSSLSSRNCAIFHRFPHFLFSLSNVIAESTSA